MINIVVKIIGALLCGFTLVYITNSILTSKEEINKIKLIIMIFMVSIITYISYSINYTVESTILRVVFCITIFKIMFNKSTYKTIISAFISMVLLSGCDLLGSLLFIKFITIEEMRSVWYWILICNISVYLIATLIISIPVIKTKLYNFIQNLDDNSIKSTIVILIILITVVIYLFYNISVNYEWSPKYYINLLIGLAYFIIMIIFFKEKSDYNNLMKQYDTLFEYFKEFEDSMDNIYLVNHEYKNQIAVLKGYIKNNDKEGSLNYINDIIEDIELDDKDIMSQLKNIPKGGIKGLLYYKIITAKNKNVSIILDISNRITNKFRKLSIDQNKIISKILGVYIDNAIDATNEIKEKIINIEIYEINKNINIVITNPIKKENIDLSNISKKGYTTKGKGHGKGLYLVNKIINRSKKLNSETTVINNYFIQKLIIHLD